MRLIATLAWRNIWRNRRRSMLAVASVLFAVLIALFMRSMQIGFYTRSIDNMVSFFSGYIQIHAAGWDEKPSLESSLPDSATPAAMAKVMPNVTDTTPRLESFALLSTGEVTEGVQVLGVQPAGEDRITGIASRIVEGRWLDPGGKGILVGSTLARRLRVAVGDTLIAMGAGYHGVSAADRFVLQGVVEFPVPELNRQIAWLDLETAQTFYAAPGRVTSVLVMIDRPGKLEKTLASLRAGLGEDYEVESWQEMMPEMVQYIQVDNAGGILMLMLIYVIIGFGMLGTVLMMTLERSREFGVLVAIGLRRRRLAGIVLLESLALSASGALAGLALSLPLLAYLRDHPIVLGGKWAEMMLAYGFEPVMPFSLDPSIFAWQTGIVLLIALIAVAYPLFKIARLDVIPAMRHGL